MGSWVSAFRALNPKPQECRFKKEVYGAIQRASWVFLVLPHQPSVVDLMTGFVQLGPKSEFAGGNRV